jgi:hypothetical protein
MVLRFSGFYGVKVIVIILASWLLWFYVFLVIVVLWFYFFMVSWFNGFLGLWFYSSMVLWFDSFRGVMVIMFYELNWD